MLDDESKNTEEAILVALEGIRDELKRINSGPIKGNNILDIPPGLAAYLNHGSRHDSARCDYLVCGV